MATSTKIDKSTKPDRAARLARLESVISRMEKGLTAPVTKSLSPARLFGETRGSDGSNEFGFKSLGHQLAIIRKAATGGASNEEMDQLHRVNKAATGLGENSGPDGGFLLAPQYVDGLLEIVHQQMDDLLSRCDKYEMTAPSMKLRAVDETSRVNGSRRGGVLGYWVDEGSTITGSKPKFRNIDLIPHKVAVLTYATEELLTDAKMMEQVISRYAAEELVFQMADAIINGTGAGKPLGILNAACTLSVSKETGQAAATIEFANVVKMWARLHSSSRSNAVWFINQDVTPQLLGLTLGIGTAGVAAYLPPGGLSDKPYATLLGKPVIEVEYCPTLGTVGDLILADMKQYIAATRGSVVAANSVHVQFLTDETAFRFTWRVAGQPWWNAALTPFKGSNTQSPFVTLATRS